MTSDMIDIEESLYNIFEDDEYAEEIRDQILSSCKIYDKEDFIVEYSDSDND